MNSKTAVDTAAAPPIALAALTELVAVKDLKDRTEALSFAGPSGPAGENWQVEYEAGRKEYIRRQPAAWEAARAVLAATPVAQPSAEPVPTGFHVVYVNEHFSALMDALGRACVKGYMPDAMAEDWEAFGWLSAPAGAGEPTGPPETPPDRTPNPEAEDGHPQVQTASIYNTWNGEKGAGRSEPEPTEPSADLTTCNCRWKGGKLIQQCTLHEAWRDAIHDWAERAKTAERRLETRAGAGEQPSEAPWPNAREKQMARCLGFFAAVIKSGEPWTKECQREYDEALATPVTAVGGEPEGQARDASAYSVAAPVTPSGAAGEVQIHAYVIKKTKRFAPEVKIERARQIEGADKWAIRMNGDCLNRSGEWEWEPSPSGREDDFLARCRFDSADEAIAAAVASQSAQDESTKTTPDAARKSGEAKK